MRRRSAKPMIRPRSSASSRAKKMRRRIFMALLAAAV
jgi:hypothetical protein